MLGDRGPRPCPAGEPSCARSPVAGGRSLQREAEVVGRGALPSRRGPQQTLRSDVQPCGWSREPAEMLPPTFPHVPLQHRL